MTVRFQQDWRIKLLKRNIRHAKERRKFEQSCVSTFAERSKFLRTRSATKKICNAYRMFKFCNTLRVANTIRHILLEEYEGRFWESIWIIIQNRAAVVIQRHVRGYQTRQRYAREVQQIKEAKRNFRERNAAIVIQKIAKGSALRKKLTNITHASIKIQKNWKKRFHRLAFLLLRNSTIRIQRFWRRHSFKIFKYKNILQEKILSGEYSTHRELSKKELDIIHSLNFVDSIRLTERLSRCIKIQKGISYIPDLLPFAPKKLRLYSYVMDVDPICDPNDTFFSNWSLTFLLFFRKLRDQTKSNFLSVSVGERHAIAFGDTGAGYHWGNSSCNQLAVFEPFMNVNPREIQSRLRPSQANFFLAGNNHNLVYSRQSKVLYAYGDNEHGQLGKGHFNYIQGIVDHSKLVRGPKSPVIVSMDVKCDQNAIVMKDGSAWVWPMPSPETDVPVPEKIFFPKEKIRQVSIGFDFTVFLTHKGKVFTMGKTGDHGELGHGDFEPRYKPTLVKELYQTGQMYFLFFSNFSISQISCGFKHVIARNNSGKIYTWGWGERGQLGHETDRNLPYPRKLMLKNYGGYIYSALNIQAGYRCSYTILEGRKILHWGTNGRILKQIMPIDYTDAGFDEIYLKKSDFKPLKICCSWSKSISVTYVTIGDCRAIKNERESMKENLCKKITEQWSNNYYDLIPKFDSKEVNKITLPKRKKQPLRDKTLNSSVLKEHDKKMKKGEKGSIFNDFLFKETVKSEADRAIFQQKIDQENQDRFNNNMMQQSLDAHQPKQVDEAALRNQQVSEM